MSKIKVGHTLPDFELPDENGDLHRLSELQGDNVMVLMLARGEHCPRERQHQREMLKFYEWCSVAFTELVTVLPNELHDVFSSRSRLARIGLGSRTPSSRSRQRSTSASTPTRSTTRTCRIRCCSRRAS